MYGDVYRMIKQESMNKEAVYKLASLLAMVKAAKADGLPSFYGQPIRYGKGPQIKKPPKAEGDPDQKSFEQPVKPAKGSSPKDKNAQRSYLRREQQKAKQAGESRKHWTDRIFGR